VNHGSDGHEDSGVLALSKREKEGDEEDEKKWRSRGSGFFGFSVLGTEREERESERKLKGDWVT